MTNVPDEMISTYYQVQHMFDKEYVSGNLIDLFNDDGSYDEMKARLLSDTELLNRVAYRYRRYIENLYTVEDEFDCLRDAFDYCSK